MTGLRYTGADFARHWMMPSTRHNSDMLTTCFLAFLFPELQFANFSGFVFYIVFYEYSSDSDAC